MDSRQPNRVTEMTDEEQNQISDKERENGEEWLPEKSQTQRGREKGRKETEIIIAVYRWWKCSAKLGDGDGVGSGYVVEAHMLYA